MAKMAKKYKASPVIRELALSILYDCPEKQWSKEVRCLLHFVQNNIKYRKDINGVETIQSPVQTLRLGQGDCDDKSLLLASLLESVGHPARFVAVGQIKGSFSHVLVETKLAGKWVPCETIMQWPLGKGPKNIKSIMIEHIKR
jgi:transglutaminase-like putative cysteine protease